MKIGFDAKRYFANFTGLGNYSRTLIENLVKYQAGHEYQLYTHKFNSESIQQFPLTEEAISVCTPATSLGKLNGAFWRSFLLKGDLTVDKPDIYHGLSHEIPFGIQRLKGLKTVVTIHDLIFLRYPEYYRWTERAIYLRKFRYACRYADRVIAVSEQTRADIIHFFGVPADKIETIHQSCDLAFQTKVGDRVRNDVKNKYGLPEDYILYVGSFNERKNLLGLIDGLELMKASLDTPLVMIGGGGQYKRQVMERINRLGLDNRVFIHSDVPNEDLPAIYQQARLFVYPSIFEGFGIPIIEAIFSGLPVVTSRDGCFPEAGGPDTRYVDPGNAEELATEMERVLTDSKLAATMIDNGLHYVSRFDGRETSSRLIRLYENLAG
jgi:glycosyltransferase involved in cell wall biosynthesis